MYIVVVRRGRGYFNARMDLNNVVTCSFRRAHIIARALQQRIKLSSKWYAACSYDIIIIIIIHDCTQFPTSFEKLLFSYSASNRPSHYYTDNIIVVVVVV